MGLYTPTTRSHHSIGRNRYIDVDIMAGHDLTNYIINQIYHHIEGPRVKANRFVVN